MANGDVKTVAAMTIEAVPAYNLVHKRGSGEPFHPKGQGNGYVITFGDKRVYVAGDTENTPEMKALKDIDIAFLPMNLPYTMTPEMVADAAEAFKPKILYPYHFGKTDTGRLVALLKDRNNTGQAANFENDLLPPPVRVFLLLRRHVSPARQPHVLRDGGPVPESALSRGFQGPCARRHWERS